MERWIVGLALWACFVGVATGQECKRSSDCAASQCCKSARTNNTLVDNPQGSFEHIIGEGDGQCVDGGARPGDMCDNHCQCPSGFECYRRITGFCCAPSTCITVAQANADRDYWRCRPPPHDPPADNDDGNDGQMENSFKSAQPKTTTTTKTPGPREEEKSRMMNSFKMPPPSTTTTTETPRMMNSFKKMGPSSGGEGKGRRSLFSSLCPEPPIGAMP
ncbi:uncharacterized protein [Littorina saxatilis]|uniref:uncharacterized protein isoform X2 n=1 Tax=Littorina saxatilis TaxID=31220 RepID=UPI0038B5A687